MSRWRTVIGVRLGKAVFGTSRWIAPRVPSGDGFRPQQGDLSSLARVAKTGLKIPAGCWNRLDRHDLRCCRGKRGGDRFIHLLDPDELEPVARIGGDFLEVAAIA